MIEASRDDGFAIARLTIKEKAFERFDPEDDGGVDIHFHSESLRLLFTCQRTFKKDMKRLIIWLRNDSDFGYFWPEFDNYKKFIRIRSIIPTELYTSCEIGDPHAYPITLTAKARVLVRELLNFPRQNTLINFSFPAVDSISEGHLQSGRCNNGEVPVITVETGDEDSNDTTRHRADIFVEEDTTLENKMQADFSCTFDLLTAKLFLFGFSENETVSSYFTNTGGIIFASEFINANNDCTLTTKLTLARVRNPHNQSMEGTRRNSSISFVPTNPPNHSLSDSSFSVTRTIAQQQSDRVGSRSGTQTIRSALGGDAPSNAAHSLRTPATQGQPHSTPSRQLQNGNRRFLSPPDVSRINPALETHFFNSEVMDTTNLGRSFDTGEDQFDPDDDDAGYSFTDGVDVQVVQANGGSTNSTVTSESNSRVQEDETFHYDPELCNILRSLTQGQLAEQRRRLGIDEREDDSQVLNHSYAIDPRGGSLFRLEEDDYIFY